MKGRPIDQLIYSHMFPRPKSNDPQNFQIFLQHRLVPEVRLETQSFYGHLSTQEAKYPGLDYSYTPHRVRLSRFTWHRRLFRAFDNLGLTEFEIAGLTKWEGTRWAKERFEREKGIVIRDTTGDAIGDWVPPELRRQVVHQTEFEIEDEDEEEIETDDDLEEYDEESDTEIEITSVGTALNERLRAAAAQRDAGNFEAPMDPDYEQWLKDTVEGFIGFPASNIHTSTNTTTNTNSNTGSRPGMAPLPNWMGSRPPPNFNSTLEAIRPRPSGWHTRPPSGTRSEARRRLENMTEEQRRRIVVDPTGRNSRVSE